MSACKTFSHQQVHRLLEEVLGPSLHAKRIASLADATLGVMHTASLAVCTIGHGLAVARSLNARHAVTQVDRVLSNPGIDVDRHRQLVVDGIARDGSVEWRPATGMITRPSPHR